MESSAEVDPTAGSGAWDLGASAAVVGNLAWFAGRTSEALASWSRDPADPEVAVAFAEQARQRAWHADLWFARLPELRELPAEPLVAPPGPGGVAFVDDLRRLGTTVEEGEGGAARDALMSGAAGCEGTALRLAVLVRVLLPHEVRATRRVAAGCGPAADRALSRTAELVRRDQVEHWEALATLLGDRVDGVTDPAQRSALLARLTGRQAELEDALVSAGGITATP